MVWKETQVDLDIYFDERNQCGMCLEETHRRCNLEIQWDESPSNVSIHKLSSQTGGARLIPPMKQGVVMVGRPCARVAVAKALSRFDSFQADRHQVLDACP